MHRGDPMPNEIDWISCAKTQFAAFAGCDEGNHVGPQSTYQTIYRDITEDKKVEEEKHRIEEKSPGSQQISCHG